MAGKRRVACVWLPSDDEWDTALVQLGRPGGDYNTKERAEAAARSVLHEVGGGFIVRSGLAKAQRVARGLGVELNEQAGRAKVAAAMYERHFQGATTLGLKLARPTGTSGAVVGWAIVRNGGEFAPDVWCERVF